MCCKNNNIPKLHSNSTMTQTTSNHSMVTENENNLILFFLIPTTAVGEGPFIAQYWGEDYILKESTSMWIYIKVSLEFYHNL